LNGCSYLWEKEQPSLARTFFEYALKIDATISPLITAQAYRLLGHLSIDLARPRAALAAYQQALTLREQLEGAESPGVADVCDSVACALTELGDVAQASPYLDRATAIHNAHDPTKMSRTLAIRALACLRGGQAEDSLEAIRECWRLQGGLTQEQVEASRYPKHSGDVMLLARILWLQGKKGEAQEFASRTIKMRRGVYGERGGPRVADSIFTVARMLEERGEVVLASRMLKEVVEICGDAPEMKAHLARAFWFSAGMEAKMDGHEDDVAELRERAREARSRIEGREWPDEDTDEGFMRLVSWMLW
jgi:tetratricopeptide (TPR) repeat protein